jgi:hypothetical protein
MSLQYTDGLGRSAYLPTSHSSGWGGDRDGGGGGGGGGGADGKDKAARANGCYATRDGRVHVSCAVSATMSPAKAAFLAAAVLAAVVWAGGAGAESSLRRRVAGLEHALSQRVGWVLAHQTHIRRHLLVGGGDAGGGGGGGAVAGGAPAVPPGGVWPDGRRHLLIPPGGVSRLAEALAPNTGPVPFDDHYLCGEAPPPTEDELIRKTVALVAVTWRAPLSLRNSMESWRRGGLLDVVDERMLFINSPSEEDRAIAVEYGFDVYTTEERGGNIMAGPALAYLVGNSSADYVLFMEKDFVLSADAPTMKRELYTGVQHLARGVDVYRLRGKTDHPAEGMPDCCAKADPPTCPYNSGWKSAGYFADHMNWLFIFCEPNILDAANGRVAMCTREPAAPDSYCFTSGESNWSNNPVLFPRAWFNDRLRTVAFKEWEHNELFEFNVMVEWLAWRPPAKVCVSYQGIFTHVEIDQ